MAKTNYTKVEESLAEGLRKMEVKRLLTIADENSATETSKRKTVSPEQRQLLASLKQELKILHKMGRDPYEVCGIDKKEIILFLKRPSKISAENWEKLKVFKEKVMMFKAEQELQGEQKTDDDLITQQRRKQITKRFNINDKWIPLR